MGLVSAQRKHGPRRLSRFIIYELRQYYEFYGLVLEVRGLLLRGDYFYPFFSLVILIIYNHNNSYYTVKPIILNVYTGQNK